MYTLFRVTYIIITSTLVYNGLVKSFDIGYTYKLMKKYYSIQHFGGGVEECMHCSSCIGEFGKVSFVESVINWEIQSMDLSMDDISVLGFFL